MYRVMILAAAFAAATPAMADTVAVTSLSSGATPSTNDGTTFTASSAELGQNRTPAQSFSSATITSDTSLSSNGSLELTGDRTRVYNDLTGSGITANSLVSLLGDYLVSNGGSGGIQSPAFRVYVQDGNYVSELIWEAAYNGGYTSGTPDSLQAGDQFWNYTYGCGFVGTTGCNAGSYVMNTLEGWGNSFSSNAIVLGIGVGQGGGAGSGFDAFADNLTLNTDRVSTTFDFQAPAAVPEPSTWAMMLFGMGGIGVAMRRRRKPTLAHAA